jgi:hypothetical protein
MVITLLSADLSAQTRNARYMQPKMLNQRPGYITFNEFSGGYGLSKNTTHYSEYFYGFNTIHGYQISKEFVLSAGTGIAIYGNGKLVPLFLDFRYRFAISRLTPYFFIDGGFLFNISDLNETKLFANPGMGASYSLSRNFAFQFGAGLFSQYEDTRDSFFNLKAGVTYKF